MNPGYINQRGDTSPKAIISISNYINLLTWSILFMR